MADGMAKQETSTRPDTGTRRTCIMGGS
jgi:hypothetical protein